MFDRPIRSYLLWMSLWIILAIFSIVTIFLFSEIALRPSVQFFAIVVPVIAVLVVWLGLGLHWLTVRRYKYYEEERYDSKRNQALLEEYRYMLERQIRELADRLTVSEQRWQDVNHLIISSQQAPRREPAKSRTRPSEYLKSMGITESDTEIESNLVFVLTPFHPDEERTFRVISEVCQDVGLTTLRGDEEYITGDILSHILKLLVKARLVVANINGRNPNVFFELGIALAIDKPTIVVSRSLGEAPFDVRSRRLVLYKTEKELRDFLKTALTQAFVQERR